MKATQNGEYCILILNKHNFYITTAAIEYCIKSKIILLCLLLHATYILQPLDVSVFSLVAVTYKSIITNKYAFRATYNINKCNFLKI